MNIGVHVSFQIIVCLDICPELGLLDHMMVLFLVFLKNFHMVAQWLKKKNPPANSGDTGLIPGLGRSSGQGNGNPLQNSYLGSPMDRGAWWAIVHGVTKRVKI